MPRAVRAALVLIVLGLASGCGSGSPARVAVPPPVQHVVRPLTPAQARTVAEAGVLTPGDMPGYAATVEHRQTTDIRAEQLVARCAGTSAGPYTYRDWGRSFDAAGTHVASSVDVAASRAQALREMNGLFGARGLVCLTQTLRRQWSTPSLTLLAAEPRAVPVSIPGSDGAAGALVELTVKRSGQVFHLLVLQLAGVVGQAELSLTVLPGGRPLSFTDALGLMTALVARTADAA